MTELRRDPIVGRWVIVKNNDSLGPDSYEKEDNTPKHWATSPFIYHREFMTPPEVAAIRSNGSASNTPGWQVRVVPNKFPALRIEGDLNKRAEGMYDVSNGVGAHEVVIETPDPSAQFADFPVDHVHNVIRMYQERCCSLAKDRRFKYIMIFKNYGESAGTSIEHAHSQIIALPMIPKFVQEKLDGARQYHSFRGRSVYADLLQQEYDDKERIITENDDFVSFCPFVPRYSFECWIYPKNMGVRFMSLSEGQQRNLARILKEALSRIKTCLSDPSYNFYLHIAPVNSNVNFEETFLWHIEIVPKLTQITGFEWGTGFYVVYTAPDQAAKYLRNVSYQEK